MQGFSPRRDEAPALVDTASGERLGHAGLDAAVGAAAVDLGHLRGAVVMLGLHRSLESVVRYLALLRVEATVALVDPRSRRERLEGWRQAYEPDAWWGLAGLPDDDGRARHPQPQDPAEERVLLPTSGTTGNPRFARLSERNLRANADQIVTALGLRPDDRAVTHLPLFYSYGLSVLHSHLAAGGCVVLSSAASVRREFRETLERERVTTLAGVPFSFEVFSRTGLLERTPSELRQVTVAGGRLGDDRLREAAATLAGRGAGLWTMYGQTEATARISVLTPDRLPERVGSAGRPVPGTTVTVHDPDEQGVGELVVEGPQVMLGYATARADIGRGDDCRGRLRTGDLGRVDEEGLLWVHGRSDRVAKVFGHRVSLDDVEVALAPLGIAAAVAAGSRILAVAEVAAEVAADEAVDPRLHRRLERAVGLPPDSVAVVAVTKVPRSASGKVDHTALGGLLGDRPIA